MDYKLYYNINEIHDQDTDKDKQFDLAKQELYTLWQDCFGDSQSYTDFYFKWKVKENQILSIYKQDKISSMLHLNPYHLRVKGKRILANYIVGVATKLQDRRQGLMKILLEASIHNMYKEHMPFTYLMPAAEAIYLPFGFEIVYEQENWNQLLREARRNTKKQASLPDKISDYHIVALGIMDSERIKELVSFSNQQLSQSYDIYTERTPYYYERLLHEMESTGGEVLLCYQSEQLIGYVSYMAEGDIYVTECIYDSKEKQAVIDAISMFIEKTVDEETLDQQTVDQETIIEKTENHNPPTIMVRIVDLKTFFQSISASEEIKLTIEVEDPIIEENNGIFILQFSEQGCEITKTKEDPEVSANIADLTKLFFGVIEKTELMKIIYGKNKNEIKSKLEKINYYKKVFINEVV